MSRRCSNCAKSLRLFENYGTSDFKLCFECANNIKCTDCSSVIGIDNLKFLNKEIYCENCFKTRTIVNHKVDNKAEIIDTNQNFESKEVSDPSLPPIQIAPNGLRGLNLLIDTTAIFVLSFLVLLFFFKDSSITELSFRMIILITTFFYYFLFESIFCITVGKLFTDTFVTDETGNRASFILILGRTLCRFIPFEGFTFLAKSGVGLHDKLSRTRVIVKRPIY